MRKIKPILFLIIIAISSLSSCITMKKHEEMISKCELELSDCQHKYAALTDEKDKYKVQYEKYKTEAELNDERIVELKNQIEDLKVYRDKQLEQVGDLTVLSKEANENIKKSLEQLEKKDKYIHLLQKARSKADSINLALAVNLKSVLKDGIEDEDIEIKVDKTVVFINLSDKMLFKSGSYELTDRANGVLAKIAKIIESKPDVELMVEGYTDNVPIKNNCITDNWDLSVKRSTSVVRVLQYKYNVDPNKLIAAGRGEYNALADNDTEEGRSVNRRTRIIIMPKLNQFYDLLNPKNIPE